MDSFYASCELALKPQLKNTPFVVGADPNEGKGRGVVLACNYPARKFGLHSGMPISMAWRLCPQAQYDRPHFELYEQVSSRVIKLLKPFADKLEQVSIDEAYMDVTNRVKLIESDVPDSNTLKVIQDLCDSVRKTVSSNEKITCSIGASECKIVSKIASDIHKPDGVTIVPPDGVIDFLAPLEVSRIPGVGTVTQRILENKFRVKTISDLRKIPVGELSREFGRNATWLSNVARGIDDSPVVEGWEPISISGETTFVEDEGDISKIKETLLEICQDVHKRATNENFLYRSVGIKIRFTGFETHTRSRSLNTASDSFETLENVALRLLSEFEGSEKKVRLIGARVANLVKKDKEQTTLFNWE
jgi:DNA polymerase IV (DinB-like DNA polymerase)